VKVLRIDNAFRPSVRPNRDQTQNIVVEIRRDRTQGFPDVTSETVAEHKFSKENA